MERLKFRRVRSIAARHSEITQNKLREKRQVEPDELNDHRGPRPIFGILPARHFSPPQMHSTQKTHQRSTDHDIMEMRDDEISIVDMHVQPNGGDEQPGHPANEEKSDKA